MGTLCKNVENIDKGEKDYNSIEKIENSFEKIEEEQNSYFFNPNKLSLQLKLSLTFIKNEKEENSYPPYITYFHKLNNNNIGIIFNFKYFSIYSLNTFKSIYSIEPEENNTIKNEVKYLYLSGFIELKNNDLLLWTSKTIIIYQKIKNSYKLLQIIDEFKQGTNYIEYNRYGDKEDECYDLNSLHELRNGFVVSCNSYGLKFYSKTNDKYTLISKQEIGLNVENILEIKENIFILFQIKSITHETPSCVTGPRTSTSNECRVSFYNIKNKKEKILLEGYFSSEYTDFEEFYSKIKYIIKDKYLFITFPNLFYIYDICQDKDLIKEKKIYIELLCNYYNDLIVAKDLNENKIKIYEFKDGKLEFYNDFPFQDFRKILRLNNYNFITYSYHQLKLLEIK